MTDDSTLTVDSGGLRKTAQDERRSREDAVQTITDACGEAIGAAGKDPITQGFTSGTDKHLNAFLNDALRNDVAKHERVCKAMVHTADRLQSTDGDGSRSLASIDFG
ncbi:MAG: hypothetical protein HOQ24_11760 [Mycobacteriaceae bacterium]|nr:hypothetical protein [Mycobacteriaceae bacterium]